MSKQGRTYQIFIAAIRYNNVHPVEKDGLSRLGPFVKYSALAYEDNSGRQRLFYPDYILRAAGETWIVEVKGGWSSSGASGNIDPFAAKKASTLNSYCARHGLRGGIVCHDDGEDILLIAETGYSEDAKDPCWKPLAEVI